MLIEDEISVSPIFLNLIQISLWYQIENVIKVIWYQLFNVALNRVYIEMEDRE